ncbi:unnamed protein product [Cylindrotheca closterium]|uniref:Uncharacterized protein n=1 Tax=Cylindrotheca closterium TaxID=2856 RepID=A0AAD2CCR6_9STRA|nr:unnamed protein product [Cylindrotheca closterium]
MNEQQDDLNEGWNASRYLRGEDGDHDCDDICDLFGTPLPRIPPCVVEDMLTHDSSGIGVGIGHANEESSDDSDHTAEDNDEDNDDKDGDAMDFMAIDDKPAAIQDLDKILDPWVD